MMKHCSHCHAIAVMPKSGFCRACNRTKAQQSSPFKRLILPISASIGAFFLIPSLLYNAQAAQIVNEKKTGDTIETQNTTLTSQYLSPKVGLIRQKGAYNSLDKVIADKKFTQLGNAVLDLKKLPITASHSLAVNTQLAALPFSAIISLEQAQQALQHYLITLEQQPENAEKLFNQAEQLTERYPDDALLQSLLQRISHYTDWQPVTSIINSAGIDFISVSGWQPESPFIRARRALLPTVAENEQVLFDDQRLVLLSTNLTPISLYIDARLDDLPFLPESPAELFYQVDDHPVQHILLNDKDDWRRLHINIPAGEHTVRLYQQQPVTNQYIKLRFDDKQSVLTLIQERPYLITTAQTPLEFYSLGPTQLRIDEINNGLASYRYQQVAEGWQKITLPPVNGQDRSLLRVSQRVRNINPKPINNRIVQRTIIPIPAPEIIAQPTIHSDKVELLDAFTLGKQQDGTLSTGIGLVRRNNQQEDGSTLSEEQFGQYTLNYRYFDEAHHAYWNSEGFLRIREHGGPSFSLDESLYYNPDWLPFSLRSSAKIIAQVPHDQPEWLGQWNIAAAKAYHLSPKTRLIPSLAFFARTLSLRTSALDDQLKIKVDQDLYTPYKADHTLGLTPALSIEHRPWLDTLWSAKIAAGSNESLNVINPDHYRSEAHWQQLLGSVTLDASYRVSFYQADGDRTAASKRSFAGLELNWQRWTDKQNRIEVAAQYNYDIERNANLATLSLTFHFGEGRGLRDFAPGEVEFRDIRQRQTLGNQQNNRMLDVDTCTWQCLGQKEKAVN